MPRTPHARSAILWLQLLLVGALACVVLILVEAYQAAHSSQVVAERALRDYGTFAAWSYREHLAARLRETVDEVLGPVNHGEGLHQDSRIPDASDMGHMLPWDAACACHRPRRGPLPARFLGFALGSDTLGLGVNFAGADIQGWLADAPMAMDVRGRPIGRHLAPASVYSAGEARRINQSLSAIARTPSRTDWGYNVTIARFDSNLRLLASRSMPTAAGDTIIYAVEYPPSALNALFDAVLSSSNLLPPSLMTRSNRDIIDLEVADSAGTPLFASPAGPQWDPQWDLDAETLLPASYGGLRVRAQLRPEMASNLLIGGLPRSRVPLLLAILLLTVGLTILAAVQLRREVRFAAERATFVANVSHELRTPLTQVRLVLDTVRLGRAGDDAARAQALGVADREVLRLQHLVEGVLRFTRGPRHDAPSVPADAAREARTVASEFQPLASPRGVRIELAGDDRVDVTLQTGALRQVLLNLLDNAVKYGRDGSTVTVDVRARSTGGVRITVTDAGPGVPAAERERIWRPFERGAAARQRAAGGSGIGLTIVREIAEEHGGKAWVQDAPGGGARFVVEMPNAAQ